MLKAIGYFLFSVLTIVACIDAPNDRGPEVTGVDPIGGRGRKGEKLTIEGKSFEVAFFRSASCSDNTAVDVDAQYEVTLYNIDNTHVFESVSWTSASELTLILGEPLRQGDYHISIVDPFGRPSTGDATYIVNSKNAFDSTHNVKDDFIDMSTDTNFEKDTHFDSGIDTDVDTDIDADASTDIEIGIDEEVGTGTETGTDEDSGTDTETAVDKDVTGVAVGNW